MSATLLHDLFGPPGLDDFPGPFAHRAREVAEELRAEWERTSRAAAETRRLDDLHAARDDYHDLLKGHLRLLEDYLALTELHQKVLGSNPVWADELRRAVDTLRTLYAELFPRWQTASDLHQIVIEKLTLPAERLRALAATYPPPAAWYEETADPFSAD